MTDQYNIVAHIRNLLSRINLLSRSRLLPKQQTPSGNKAKESLVPLTNEMLSALQMVRKIPFDVDEIQDGEGNPQESNQHAHAPNHIKKVRPQAMMKTTAQPSLLTMEIPYDSLPKILARTMRLIETAGKQGISTLELQENNCLGCSTVICRLRLRGAVITTIPKTVVDDSGEARNRVAHYVFEGWETDQHCDQEVAA